MFHLPKCSRTFFWCGIEKGILNFLDLSSVCHNMIYILKRKVVIVQKEKTSGTFTYGVGVYIE